jgi:hypothetical protein
MRARAAVEVPVPVARVDSSRTGGQPLSYGLEKIYVSYRAAQTSASPARTEGPLTRSEIPNQSANVFATPVCVLGTSQDWVVQDSIVRSLGVLRQPRDDSCRCPPRCIAKHRPGC